jgi:hypothetical protein
MNFRDTWQARGSNYDPARLEVYTNESGFILGVSKLGDKLGVDGAEVLLPATSFTGINISTTCSVETGLFVHRDTAVCNLTATMPSHIALMKKRLAVKYDGVTIFKGTVQEVEWTEEMDGRYWLPGNTDRKAYSVSLTVTAGDEDFSDAETPVIGLGDGQVYGVVAGWLGIDYDATYSDPADDLGKEQYFNVRDWLSTRSADVSGSLQDSIGDALKIWNLHYIYKPWDSLVEFRNNNRWHSGTNETDTLFFSDNIGDDDQAAGSDEYIHEDRFVMYSSRQTGYESALYQGSVKVSITNFLTSVETTYGPFRASELRPSDPVINLGKLDTDDYAAMARNYVSTLPLKRSSEQFTKSITMPLQSIKQLEDVQVPGMALLKHENTTERVAVLGVSHSITPNQWTVTYVLGPHHLLDRESDFDPSLPIDGSLNVVGSIVNVQWHTPRALPTDVPLWRYVFRSVDAFGNTISWSDSGDMVVVSKSAVSGEVTGDTQTASFTKPVGSGSYDYYVAYTSDPNPGSGVVNQQYRQSQPKYLGRVVVP